MSDNYDIHRFEQLLDYVYHNLTKAEELAFEAFMDTHDDFAQLMDELLDCCLSQNLTRPAVQFLLKTHSHEGLNLLQYRFENLTKTSQSLEPVLLLVKEQPLQVTPTKARPNFAQWKKSLFTFLLVAILPYFMNTNNSFHSSLLMASSQQRAKTSVEVTDFEMEYMKVDMLDEQPIINHLTVVTLPSIFELRYITDN